MPPSHAHLARQEALHQPLFLTRAGIAEGAKLVDLVLDGVEERSDTVLFFDGWWKVHFYRGECILT
jgi:hypothetical protein